MSWSKFLPKVSIKRPVLSLKKMILLFYFLIKGVFSLQIVTLTEKIGYYPKHLTYSESEPLLSRCRQTDTRDGSGSQEQSFFNKTAALLLLEKFPLLALSLSLGLLVSLSVTPSYNNNKFYLFHIFHTIALYLWIAGLKRQAFAIEWFEFGWFNLTSSSFNF